MNKVFGHVFVQFGTKKDATHSHVRNSGYFYIWKGMGHSQGLLLRFTVVVSDEIPRMQGPEELRRQAALTPMTSLFSSDKVM